MSIAHRLNNWLNRNQTTKIYGSTGIVTTPIFCSIIKEYALLMEGIGYIIIIWFLAWVYDSFNPVRNCSNLWYSNFSWYFLGKDIQNRVWVHQSHSKDLYIKKIASNNHSSLSRGVNLLMKYWILAPFTLSNLFFKSSQTMYALEV